MGGGRGVDVGVAIVKAKCSRSYAQSIPQSAEVLQERKKTAVLSSYCSCSRVLRMVVKE